jgi:hypothetical protein
MKTLLTALFTTMLVLVGAPAMADKITIKDPAHDHVPPGGQNTRGLGDVIRVRVDHAPRRVYVDTVFRTKPYDILEVWLDTRKARSGPEFYLLKTPFGVTLWRYRAEADDKRVKCADKRVRYLPKKRTWAAYVNRACLATKKGKTPRQVRVRVLSASDDYIFTRDYVPGRHRYSRWVQHN